MDRIPVEITTRKLPESESFVATAHDVSDRKEAEEALGDIRERHLITLDAITSIATTLGARTVAPEALAWTRRHLIRTWTVSDREAVDACLRFADDHRILVEPACGAALATVYDGAAPLAGRAPVLVIVCGGAGASRALLDQWDRQTSAGESPSLGMG